MVPIFMVLLQRLTLINIKEEEKNGKYNKSGFNTATKAKQCIIIPKEHQ